MKRPRPKFPSRAANSPASKLVQIEKPIYGGAFLARVVGKAMFVPLTLPGEQARVRIIEEKKSYAFAEPEEIVASSSDRVVPGCPHFGVCGGCNYQHAGYTAQLTLKEAILRETFERAGVPAPEKIDVLAGNPWQYRNRIRLGFDAAGRPGYRSRRSHEIIGIHECPISAPSLVQAALTVSDVVQQPATNLCPSEVSLFCNPDESAILATVLLREAVNVRTLEPFIQEWTHRTKALRGIQFVISNSRQQDPQPLHTWGERSLIYRVGNVDYRVDNGAFFQVNRWLLDALADRVIADRAGKLAWDLFAGVGLFARRLASRFDRVDAVESAAEATDALEANLKGTTGVCVRAETLQFLRNQNRIRPDLIIVDPPRTGLGAETTSLLSDIAAPNIVYVSCDPATLARDLHSLRQSGYAIASVTLADLFPQTFHLETVAELQRS